MQTVTAHISRRCRPFVASAVPVLVLALLSSAASAAGQQASGTQFTQTRITANRAEVPASYGWPVKPFNRQHPVRGYLNDPRPSDDAAIKSFHFGIDISAPDGTAVYAVEGGEVFLTRGRSAVAVKGATRTFGYWHIVPVVRNHQQVQLHQLLGHVLRGERHVHLAERHGADYLNPLRPGGIGPYVDRTPPTLASVEFLRGGQEQDALSLRGRIDVIVEAFDTTPLVVPAPWSNLPVTPARIRWGVSQGSRSVIARRIAAPGFSRARLAPELYDSIYAPGTAKNGPGRPGHYRFYLAHKLDVSRLPAGRSVLRIEANDTRGNLVVAEVEIAKAR
jgi:hypothetical protein